jgi:hypothetical protein
MRRRGLRHTRGVRCAFVLCTAFVRGLIDGEDAPFGLSTFGGRRPMIRATTKCRPRRVNGVRAADTKERDLPVHDASYDASARRLSSLAEQRTADVGGELLDAATAFKRAVVACLEGWEDEADAGESFRRPQNFPEVWQLFTLATDATRLAATVRRHRDLSYVLATEPHAAEAA